MNKLNHQKVLFISHEASLSGAPILLFNLVKWLQENTSVAFDILCVRGGDLLPEFRKIARKTYTVESCDTFYSKNLRRVNNRVFKKSESLSETATRICNKLIGNKYDYVYGNSLETLLWMLPFKLKGIPCICAIHELTFSVESTFQKPYVLENINKIDCIIAGSKAVGDNLIARYGAIQEKVQVVHSFIEDNMETTMPPIDLRARMGISESQVVFGLASSQELRKGTDIVPMLVREIVNQTPDLDFKFINLGGSVGNTFVRMAKLDAEKLGVLDKIIFVDHTKAVNDYLNMYDVFVMISREDPFPLVTLAAAKLGKPIIAFANAGGADEFLENETGILVPYLNLTAFAKKLIMLAKSPDLRSQFGAKANVELENKYSQKLSMKKILNIFEQLNKNK